MASTTFRHGDVRSLSAFDVTDPAPWCVAIRDTVVDVFVPLMHDTDELWLFGSVHQVATGATVGCWPADTDVAVVSGVYKTLDPTLEAAASQVASITGSPVHLTVASRDTASVDVVVRSHGVRLA